jgi:Arc/MetJ-type ribon-helix-helix transcriptional regulator
MKTIKLKFTIPEDVAERLQSLVSKGRQSAFVAAAVAEKLKRLEEEQLRQELIEGYQARRVEDSGLNKEWERATLENWPE